MCIFTKYFFHIFSRRTLCIILNLFFWTLYAPCIVLQCVDKPTRCTDSYKLSLFINVWLYMFRTITCPSSGTPYSKLYHAFGTIVQASLAATWLCIQVVSCTSVSSVRSILDVKTLTWEMSQFLSVTSGCTYSYHSTFKRLSFLHIMAIRRSKGCRRLNKDVSLTERGRKLEGERKWLMTVSGGRLRH